MITINEAKRKRKKNLSNIYINPNAGNIELGNQMFNSAMSLNTQALGENLEFPLSDNIEFVVLSPFKRGMKENNINKEDLDELKLFIKNKKPEVDLGGGVYKLRWSPNKWHMGLRGTLRIIYIYKQKDSKIYLIALYNKNNKDNLGKAELNNIKKLAKNI